MGNHINIVVKLCMIHLALSAVFCNEDSTSEVQTDKIEWPGRGNSEGKYCRPCRLLITSFEKGLLRTALKSDNQQDRSELRLAEVKKRLCIDVGIVIHDCLEYAKKTEKLIDQWWSQDPENAEDIFNMVCVKQLEVCCPEGHYGRDCKPCPSRCSGQGRCRGDGSRKGNGTCACETGYAGDHCEQCDVGFFVSGKTEKGLKCSECHFSCSKTCTGPTERDCNECKNGFKKHEKKGCIDINECEKDVCKKNEFCYNLYGTFQCGVCARNCETCYSDGPDACITCRPGFTYKKGMCAPEHDYEQEMDDQLTAGRYMTYCAFVVILGVLLPTNTVIGTIVGICALSYVVASEYYCYINGHEGLFNWKKLNYVQHFTTKV